VIDDRNRHAIGVRLAHDLLHLGIDGRATGNGLRDRREGHAGQEQDRQNNQKKSLHCHRSYLVSMQLVRTMAVF
jgi:hypothetical protein